MNVTMSVVWLIKVEMWPGTKGIYIYGARKRKVFTSISMILICVVRKYEFRLKVIDECGRKTFTSVYQKCINVNVICTSYIKYNWTWVGTYIYLTGKQYLLLNNIRNFL